MSDHTQNTTYKRLLLKQEISFRLAREDDLPKLEWQGAYTHFRTVFRNTYSDQQQGRRLMLLADYNNYPIGQIFILIKEQMSGLGSRRRQGYLYSLRVMDAFQNLGIGTRLIIQAEKLMREQNLAVSTIAVAKDNPRALRLYQRLGYYIYAEDEGLWSYTNHENQQIHVHEPCWMLEKYLKPTQQALF